MLNVMQGTLTADGTIILEGKPTLPAGPVKVRIESIPAPRNQADWDAAVKGLDDLKDYDFDAVQRGRDYDLQHAKDHLP
jgi:hypothetical protein